MLLSTFSTGVLLALLGVPGVLATREPSLSLPPALLPVSVPSVSHITPLDDLPSVVPRAHFLPTRVRRTPSPASDFAPINPIDVPVRVLAHDHMRVRSLTNAQRIANNLPPRSPALNRHRRRPLSPRQSPAPCPLPQVTGTIRVTNVDSGATLGSLSSKANSFGEYGVEGGLENGFLEVVLRRCADDGLPFEIETLNGLKDFPYFGGVVGFASSDDDISDANANYVYIGGTTPVAPGPAQAAPNAYSAATDTPRDVESALWTLGADGALTMNWTNTDGAPAQGAHLVYVPGAGADTVVLTGSVDLFRARFGSAVSEVVLTFVPDA